VFKGAYKLQSDVTELNWTYELTQFLTMWPVGKQGEPNGH